MPIIPLDLEAVPLEEIVKAFQGQEIIISGVMPHTSDIEKKLATAAKEVGVKRFIPSFFAPLAPPTGVNILREIVRLREMAHTMITSADFLYRKRRLSTMSRNSICHTPSLMLVDGIKYLSPTLLRASSII